MEKETAHPKQTAETARKAKRIRKLRDNGITWEKICLELRILKKDGTPDTGLAHRIAYGGYEPKTEELRDRLGLRKLCQSCGRGFRKAVSTIGCLPPWRAWWSRLDPAERDRRIREHYERRRNE